MNFLKNIGQSIYSPEYYADLQKKPFSYSFVYFLKLALVLSLIISAVLTFYLTYAVNKVLPGFFSDAGSIYPPELVITLEGGAVRTNVTEPYIIPLTEEMRSDFQVKAKFVDIENLIVINTNSEADLALYRDLKTLVLVGKHDVIIPDDNGAIVVQPVGNFPDFVLDKTFIDNLINKIQSWSKFIIPLAFLIILPILFIFGVMWQMMMALLWALVVWLIAAIQKVKIGYGKAYQMALHLMTILLLLQVVRMFVFDPEIPFLSLIVIVLFTVVNLTKSRGEVVA